MIPAPRKESRLLTCRGITTVRIRSRLGATTVHGCTRDGH